MVEFSNLTPPRLMIIAERGYCPSTEAWLTQLESLASILRHHPSVMLQVRNKFDASDWPVVYDFCCRMALQLPKQVLLNGWIWPACSLLRHLPEALLSVPHSPTHFGASIHSLEALNRAENHPVHFVQYGAIYPTSKPVTPLGVSALNTICDATHLPVLAVGGIQSLEQISDCLKAGAHGVSIGSWILNASDPSTLIAEIVRHIQVTCDSSAQFS